MRPLHVLGFVVVGTSFAAGCVTQGRYDRLKAKYSALKETREQSQIQRVISSQPHPPTPQIHPQDGDSHVPLNQILEKAQGCLLEVETVHSGTRSVGLGVIVGVEDDSKSSTGKTAFVLTSRLLVDSLHPFATWTWEDISSSETPHSITLRWPFSSEPVEAKVEWISPCETAINRLYSLDLAVLTVPLPPNQRVVVPQKAPRADSEGDCFVVTRRPDGSLVALRDRVRPEPGDGAPLFQLATTTYQSSAGMPFPLGAPVFDQHGQLLGIVDASGLFQKLRRLAVDRDLAESYLKKAERRIEAVSTTAQAYYEALDRKVTALREPGGIAFLVKEIVGIFNPESRPGATASLPAKALTVGGIASAGYSRYMHLKASSQLATAVQKGKSIGLVTEAKTFNTVGGILGGIVGIADAVGNWLREGHLDREFEESEVALTARLKICQGDLDRSIQDLTEAIDSFWAERLQLELQEQKCTLRLASQELSRALSELYTSGLHGVAFALPATGGQVLRGEEPYIFIVSKGRFWGRLLQHPESRVGNRWDLLGLAATWLSHSASQPHTFDPLNPSALPGWSRDKAGLWEFSREGEKRLVAILHNGGIGYVWEFGWPSSDSEGEAIAMRVLETFRFERSADFTKEDHSTRKAILAAADKARNCYEHELALQAYRWLLIMNPGDPYVLNQFVWTLAMSEVPSVRRPEIAAYYAQRLERLLSGDDFTKLDTVAWAYFTAGDVAKALNIEAASLERIRKTGAKIDLESHVQRSVAVFRFWNEVAQQNPAHGAAVQATSVGRLSKDTSRRHAFPIELREHSSVLLQADTIRRTTKLNLFVLSEREYQKYAKGESFTPVTELSVTDALAVSRSGTLPAGRHWIVTDNIDRSVLAELNRALRNPALDALLPAYETISYRLRITAIPQTGKQGPISYECQYLKLIGILGPKDNNGVAVGEVIAGSPASELGMKAGDVLKSVRVAKTWINVQSIKQLGDALLSVVVGDRIGVRFLRDGKEHQGEYRVAYRDPFDLQP